MKRSSHVALLVMGVTGAGVGGYALSGPRDCSQQATVAPGPGTSGPTSCSSGNSGDSGGGSGSRWSRSASGGPTSGSSSSGGSSIGSTVRSGFGSFGRALSGGG